MKRIDFHTHIFPDKIAAKAIAKLEACSQTNAHTDGTLAGLERSMQQGDIALSVVQPVATAPSQVISSNDFAHKLNQTHANIHSFGAMHPDFTDYKAELARMQQMGLLGVKLHPDYQSTRFDDIRYKRILEAACALDLIVLVHAGVDIGLPEPIHATPDMVCEVVRDVQPHKLVLAHMGGCCMWDEVLDKLAGRGLYLDTAFSLGEVRYFEHLTAAERKLQMMPEGQFLQFVQAFGDDHILFGTDNPWGGQAQTAQVIEGFALTQAQKENIFFRNAEKLLKKDGHE